MNHVQIIKNRFEKLNNSKEIESLDITPLRTERFSKFQRSATLIDFSRFKLDDDNNGEINLHDEVIGKTTDPVNQKKSDSRQFIRQNSIGSNSSYKSIRRSPAFRLDVQKKPNLLKNSPASPTKITRQSPLRPNPANRERPQVDELQYIATSETIKKALKKPLPNTPAPPKPPRTFAASPRNSPIKDNVCIVTEFEKKRNELRHSPENIRIQVNDLERKLQIKPNTFPKKAVKADSRDRKGISTFLNCIISPCSIDPIYYEQVKREQRLLKRDTGEEEEEEEIYSEPFVHLEKSKSNFKPTEELHYMCTNILDQTNNNSSFESIDTNGSSLDKDIKDSSDIETYEKVDF